MSKNNEVLKSLPLLKPYIRTIIATSEPINTLVFLVFTYRFPALVLVFGRQPTTEVSH